MLEALTGLGNCPRRLTKKSYVVELSQAGFLESLLSAEKLKQPRLDKVFNPDPHLLGSSYDTPHSACSFASAGFSWWLCRLDDEWGQHNGLYGPGVLGDADEDCHRDIEVRDSGVGPVALW